MFKTLLENSKKCNRQISCFIVILMCAFGSAFSQEENYSMLTLPKEMLGNANAVIRNQTENIEIMDYKKMRINQELAVTVLNENGDRFAQALEFYDGTIKIKSQQAIVYDAFGNEIEKFKKNDFNDVSAIGSGDLYTDNRYSYLDYTPTEYPYTMVYTSEVETSETAFIRPWYPITGPYVSVMQSNYRVSNRDQIPIRFKESNLENYNISTNNSEFELDYKIENAAALEAEALAVSFRTYVPEVLVALNDFSLVGVRGQATNWESFGAWQYKNLIQGLDALPPETVEQINNLVADAGSTKEKIKRIYKYVQNKTRYISVQLGIGGWRPYSATSVDNLGYGDCKGLTNYTKALLGSQGIKAYYTVVWAGDKKRDIDSEFASMQGNHVILNVPLDNEEVWLECTSQTLPFNYLGNFTDDRNVLVITDNGGEIKRTVSYLNDDNLQESEGRFVIDSQGGFTGKVNIVSKGSQYYSTYTLKQKNASEINEHYLGHWDNFTNLQVSNIQLDNNKDNVAFTQQVELAAQNYGEFINDKLIFKPNAYNINDYLPRNYRNRKHNFKIARGYKDTDTYSFTVPSGMQVDYLPEPVNLEEKFGSYSMSVTPNEDGSFTYKRSFSLNNGEYPAADYKAYRNFRKKIRKYDNAKVVFKQ